MKRVKPKVNSKKSSEVKRFKKTTNLKYPWKINPKMSQKPKMPQLSYNTQTSI